MASLDSILRFSDIVATKFTVNASSSSAEQAFGQNTIVAINADQDIMIRFGAAGAVTAAAATDFRIPANATITFMTSRQWPSFKVFNNGSSTANVYIQPLSQF